MTATTPPDTGAPEPGARTDGPPAPGPGGGPVAGAPVGEGEATAAGAGRSATRRLAEAATTRLAALGPEGWVSLGVVAAAAAFVAWQLHPELVLSDSTPTGGDMAAHVWAPAWLRDHLLPSGRLTGWTPDWYAGFPAFHFYMVLPSLLIVLLDVGAPWPLALLGLVLAAGLGLASRRAGNRLLRVALVVAAALLALGVVGIPYNVAFKLVAVSGLVAFPVACWAFGRLAGLRFPGPPLLAVGGAWFLFDASFTIYGGNVFSTMAGEFAFSISLALAVVALGLVARGLETGGHRAAAAAALALCGLSHIIPAFFALGGVAVLLALRPGREQLRWLGAVVPVAGLLGAFWALPFVLQRSYLNDMGWEKIGDPVDWSLNPLSTVASIVDVLPSYGELLLPDDMVHLRWIVGLAIAGFVLALVLRVRVGVFLGVIALLLAAAVVIAPQGRLWNARLTPFYYLCLYLLAAVAVAVVARAVASLVAPDPTRPRRGVTLGAPVVGLVAVVLVVGVQTRSLPFGSTADDGTYSWLGIDVGARNDARSWVRWNFEGLEGKDAYPELEALVSTMGQVGEERGCGRSLWEYGEQQLSPYGSPMALMLLPYFTDGCIGSMEGLYFEASATTPYHFLVQSQLSAQPSRPQRNLPYDVMTDPGVFGEGVRNLQLLGVRYYLAFSPQATSLADSHPDLEQVAASGPWRVYEVSGAPLVEGLALEPAVLTGDIDPGKLRWLPTAVQWFTDPTRRDVLLALDGPEAWQRVEVAVSRSEGARTGAPGTVDVDDVVPRRLPEVAVSEVVEGDSSVRFRVDRTGVPVLVKVSAFPNWRVSGAEGPYRATPNLMVVVPTQEEVELSYGRSPVELVATALSLVGLVLLGLLLARPDPEHRRTPPWPGDADGPPGTDGPEVAAWGPLPPPEVPAVPEERVPPP